MIRAVSKTRYLITQSLLLLTIAAGSCGGPEKESTYLLLKRNLADTLRNIQAHSAIPGFGVIILKNDSILFMEGFGKANIRQGKNYTEKTIQPIASISKTFIGLALMKAIEQGFFTLETDVNEILPFQIKNPYYPETRITIRHLVTHTSSLLDNDTVFTNSYTTASRPCMELGDFIRQYFVHGGKFYTPINFSKVAPGKEFNYSNIAAALGAYLIELKSKMPFTEYTSEYIFKPLGMKDTHWFYDSSKKEQYAVLYEITKHHAPEYKWLLNADKSVKPYTDITYPDGKLYSSIEDMGKYLSAMIRGYSGNGGIISAKSFKILFSKNFDEDHPPGGLEKSEPNRAVFWAYDVNGNIVHTGSDYGLTTFISFNPISKTGHVLFFNTAFDGEDNEQPILHARKILKTIRSFEEAVK